MVGCKDVKKPVFVEIFFRYLWENKTDICGNSAWAMESRKEDASNKLVI